MSSKEAISRQITRIKSEADIGLAIEMLADVTIEVEESGFRRDKEIKEQLSILREVIVGNGKPTASLVARMESVEDCTTQIGEDVKKIHDAVMGDMDVATHRKSLLSRVGDNEDVIKGLKRIGWALLIGLALDAASRLIPLLFP